MSDIKLQLNGNIVMAVSPEEVLRVAISYLPNDHKPLESEKSLSAYRNLQVSNPPELRKIKNEIFRADITFNLNHYEAKVEEFKGEKNEEGLSEAERLINLINNSGEILCDQHDDVYLRIFCGGIIEAYRCDGEEFRHLAIHKYYSVYDLAPSEAHLKKAVQTILAQGRFDCRRVQTAKRIFAKDGVLYIDLCNRKGEVAEIDPAKENFTITTTPPVLFVRTRSMQSLPYPELGGDFEDLRDYINIPDNSFYLLLVWITMCLRADVEYCLLELIGEQGSAKSTTQKILKMLIDPSIPQLCRAPSKSDDLFVLADHHHLISLENMSKMSNEISDDCCTIITGGGRAKRKLYTDSDLSMIEIRRPIVINGISPIVERPDLLDRTLHIETPKIVERITKSDLEADFEKQKGKIFGDLLNLMQEALAVLPRVNINKKELPRLADFSLWGEAIYTVLDEEPGVFISEFKDMQMDGVHRTIESSPVVVAMISYLDEEGSFKGLIGHLFLELESYRQSGEAWPRSAKGLANTIRRYGPALEKIGIQATISSERTAKGYGCVLRKLRNKI